MIYLILFVIMFNIIPIVYFASTFWKNRENEGYKEISLLSLINTIGFTVLMVVILRFYVPFINQVNSIGTDEWYKDYIVSEKGEPYRL